MLRPKKNLKKEFGNEKNTCDSIFERTEEGFT